MRVPVLQHAISMSIYGSAQKCLPGLAILPALKLAEVFEEELHALGCLLYNGAIHTGHTRLHSTARIQIHHFQHLLSACTGQNAHSRERHPRASNACASGVPVPVSTAGQCIS